MMTGNGHIASCISMADYLIARRRKTPRR